MNTEAIARKKYHIKKDDIYNASATVRQIMKYSFHLPVDVLTDKNWGVLEPVILDPAKIPDKFITQVYIDGNEELFWKAKQVALSARVHHITGDEFIVGRIWFGKEIK